MVRLRQALSLGISRGVVWFQSHYGAIATCLDRPCNNRAALFQSHYGAIATPFPQANSPAVLEFQSHYGAIATPQHH